MPKFLPPQQNRSSAYDKGRKQLPPANEPLPELFEITEAQCKVCQHAQRRRADLMLATGWSQAQILTYLNETLEEGDETISRNSISNHARRHVSMRDAGIRRIMETRAKQIGMDVDTVEDFILTKEATLEAVIHTGLESMVRGETVVEPKDMLGAIAALEKIESQDRNVSVEEFEREFRLFIAAVKKIVPAEMWERIYLQFESELDTVAKPLEMLLAGRDIEVIEAEADEENNEQ